MSIFVSILGLGFLILIHEAGHFFVARGVGMNPRKFYLGFPPALVKTKRNGIEYGVGAVPLGGYVKIPGMHRPAAGDLAVHFGRAVEEDPSLRRPVDELRATPRGERLRGRAGRRRTPGLPDRRGASVARRAQVRRARSRRDRRCAGARRVLACEHLEARRRHLRRPGSEPAARRDPLRAALHGRRRQGDPDGRRDRPGHTRREDGAPAGRSDRRDQRQHGRRRRDRGTHLGLGRRADPGDRRAGRQDGRRSARSHRRRRMVRTASDSSCAAKGSGRSSRPGRPCA